MKKTFTAALAISIAIVLFVACTRDKQTTDTPTTVSAQSTHMVITAVTSVYLVGYDVTPVTSVPTIGGIPITGRYMVASFTTNGFPVYEKLSGAQQMHILKFGGTWYISPIGSWPGGVNWYGGTGSTPYGGPYYPNTPPAANWAQIMSRVYTTNIVVTTNYYTIPDIPETSPVLGSKVKLVRRYTFGYYTAPSGSVEQLKFSIPESLKDCTVYTILSPSAGTNALSFTRYPQEIYKGFYNRQTVTADCWYVAAGASSTSSFYVTDIKKGILVRGDCVPVSFKVIVEATSLQ